MVHGVTALRPAPRASRILFTVSRFLLKLTVYSFRGSYTPLRFIDYSNVLKNFYRSLSQ